MFSSFFGKRRSSPVEDETPPIPGPKDDGFVVVDPTPIGSIYPSVGPLPYPARPAPAAPLPRARDEQPFHYLQGVPFSLSKELQMSTNKTAFTQEISDLLAFLTNKISMDTFEYDFTVEKSVLKEC